MTENDLYEQIAQYLNYQYPDLIYHFDLSGVWTPSHKARNLYGRLNQRAFPDLFIAKPAFMPGTVTSYHGMFLELKRDGTRLKKRDGSWASDHVAEQAEVLRRLSNQRYVAQFAVGFTEAKELIDSYLNSSARAVTAEAF